MAAAFVRASASTNIQGTSESIVITGLNAAATNAVIVLGFSLSTDATTVVSVVCSAGLTGTATLVKAQVIAGLNRVEVWVIPAPSGSGTITVTLTGGACDWQAHAIVGSGADQATPCPTGDAVSTVAAGSPQTVTPTNLTANDMVVGFGAVTGGDAPTWTTGVETYNDNDSGVNMAAGYHLGTGSVSVTYGAQANDVLVAVRVVAAAVVTAPSVTPSLGRVKRSRLAQKRRRPS